MAHHKRRKCRRRVRCTICTPNRWRGNNAGRFSARYVDRRKAVRRSEADND